MSLRVDPAWLAPKAPEIAGAQNFSGEVQDEDIAICERVQQLLGSGSYFVGRLIPKRESGVNHFHGLYRRTLRT